MPQYPWDQTYIINLARSSDRLEKAKALCAEVSLFPERVEAVDGKALSLEDRKNATTGFCNTFCTPAMIATAMSHQLAWQRILDSRNKTALILEDDCTFIPEFTKLASDMKYPDCDWDVLYLGCLWCHESANEGLTGKIFKRGLSMQAQIDGPIHYNEKWMSNVTAVGFHGYIVSQNGARKLLKLTQNQIAEHIDGQVYHLTQKGLLTTFVHKPLLINQSSTGFQSHSTITKCSFPFFMNRALDYFEIEAEPNMSQSFFMSSPVGQVGGCSITVWTLIYFKIGLILGFMDRKARNVAMGILFAPDLILNVKEMPTVLGHLFITYGGIVASRYAQDYYLNSKTK